MSILAGTNVCRCVFLCAFVECRKYIYNTFNLPIPISVPPGVAADGDNKLKINIK